MSFDNRIKFPTASINKDTNHTDSVQKESSQKNYYHYILALFQVFTYVNYHIITYQNHSNIKNDNWREYTRYYCHIIFQFLSLMH